MDSKIGKYKVSYKYKDNMDELYQAFDETHEVTQEDINKQISLLEKDIKNSDPKTEDDKLILRRKQEKLKLIKNVSMKIKYLIP